MLFSYFVTSTPDPSAGMVMVGGLGLDGGMYSLMGRTGTAEAAMMMAQRASEI
jgi:hypothetical protein